ncbi:MFS transporter [Herbiconiux moechotypicola]|uniref:MFS transporter n=1 Tax=Herbiconiux moechotypicola TaxID=637393 RepID=A0ABP5QEH1_9MICO|nr:MFS transporter [Herbiconiux moechotypicola]MCS5729528.1 MFS transporter [Herbiconiux moechotypicola]
MTARTNASGPRLGPLYAAGFVTAFGANGVAAVVGGTHAELGLSLAWLGLFLALYDVAELILKPVFGALADRIGPKPVIVGGLLAFGVASLLGVFVGGAFWLAVIRLLQGAGASAFSPASSAAVARLAPAERTATYFGRYGSWKGIGYAGGPVLGALIVLVADVRLLFGVLAMLAFATAFAVQFAVASIAPHPRKRSTLATLVRSITARDFLVPVVVLATGSAAIGALTGMLPALGTAIGVPLLLSTAAIAVLAITSALLQPLAGRWSDAGRYSARTATMAGTAAIAVAFVLVGLLPSVATMFTAVLLTGLGVALLTPVAFAHLAATSSPDRLGRTMGSAELGRETGDAVGPLLIGFVGTASLPLGFAGFGVLATAALAVASRLPRPTGDHGSA